MHPTPFQLWWRHIKTTITNDSGNYNITDLSLYKDRMMKDRFVNSYTTRGTSKECPLQCILQHCKQISGQFMLDDSIPLQHATMEFEVSLDLYCA